MAKGGSEIVPLLFQRWKDGFEAVDWTAMLGGPYELTNPIQTMMMEAGQKGMVVIVQASLVPYEEIFPPEEEREELEEPEETEQDYS